MSTNKIYDVVIVGATPEGLTLYQQLKETNPTLNILIISEHFKYCKTAKVAFESLNAIQQKVEYAACKRDIFSLSLADRQLVLCFKFVIATGTKPIKSTIKTPHIRYNLLDIQPNKNGQAVVIGNDNLAATYAIDLAKKFKYVYLCTSSINLACDQKYQKKINEIANILHLPNCNLTSCKQDKEGNLVEVVLDTYSSIKASTLVCSLGKLPDSGKFAPRLFALDTEGYIEVDENGKTTLGLPIYAIGPCTRYSSTKQINAIRNKIVDKLK